MFYAILFLFICCSYYQQGVLFLVLTIYQPFFPRKSSKSGSALYTSYSSCTNLKTYFFAFNKSNTPSFSPNFRLWKPVLKFAFNHNTNIYSVMFVFFSFWLFVHCQCRNPLKVISSAYNMYILHLKKSAMFSHSILKLYINLIMYHCG